MEIISIQPSVMNINRFHNKNVSRLKRERQSKKGCPIELKLLMIQNITEVKGKKIEMKMFCILYHPGYRVE